MPMIDIQRRHAEVFRVRFGEKGPNGAPRKLTDQIRITSRNRLVVEAFVESYGGEVSEWESQWQAYLPTTELRIMVLPGQSVHQWWEFYRGSVCERRCDGYQEQKSGKRCVCPEDIAERMKDRDACSPTTRVNVLCPDVNVVGAGSLVTHGLIAAETLPQSIAIAEAALARGYMVPAILRAVEHKGRTHFIVPQVEIVGVSLQTLASGDAGGDLPSAVDARAVTAGEGPKLLDPVPQEMEQTPVASISEQATTFPERRQRSNSAQPIPATGVEPRTVDQVQDTPDTDDAWSELQGLLGPDVDGSLTKDLLEADLRRMYDLMETVGIWPADSLHKALAKYAEADHVGDMNKTEAREGKSTMGLVPFMELSWGKAREAVKKHDERPFEEEQ